ncbi:MAG: HAD-IIIA family hydrolase [Ignavibacteria bacterium]|nr:HAD-IIIA family hydrolase [Ignavibacteria bacterium]
MNKAIFLDRDGTILEEIPGNSETFGYLTSINDVKLIRGSSHAIAEARKLGYKIIIVTNQSAIARGLITESELTAINNRMFELLLNENPEALIDDLYYSPYHKDGVIEKYKTDHPSRKPDIGMLLDAQKKYNIDFSSSFMIGDAYSDIVCGINAGVKNILVLTGYGKMTQRKCLDEKLKIDFIANDLQDAVKIIKENFVEK